jgi:CubicO group peptidase (beta-lactamase class C family)
MAALATVAALGFAGHTHYRTPDPAVIQELMARAKMPSVSVAVVNSDDGLLYNASFGLGNPLTSTNASARTMYTLASISKTFTATLVMQAVESGALSLDAPICDTLSAIWPRCATAGGGKMGQVTLRHLITHTSCIQQTASFDRWEVEPDDCAWELGSLHWAHLMRPDGWAPGCAAPGTQYHYSGPAVSIAMVAASLGLGGSGEFRPADMDALAGARIFAPLGVAGSAQWTVARGPPAGRELAQPCVHGLNRSLATAENPQLGAQLRGTKDGFMCFGRYGKMDWPAVCYHRAYYSIAVGYLAVAEAAVVQGMLRATAPALAEHLRMFMRGGAGPSGRLLAEATVEEMRRVQYPSVNPHMGLIWTYRTLGNRTLLGHEGGDPGVSTYMGFDVHAGVGVVLLTNGGPHLDSKVYSEAMADIEEYLLDQFE